MIKLCPFKKEIETTIMYGYTTIEREKPIKIKKEERFYSCDGLDCMAYDGGICKMMERK